MIPVWVWVLWIVFGLVLEGIALANGTPGDTLTEYTVAAGLGWLGVGFGAWLVTHFKDR